MYDIVLKEEPGKFRRDSRIEEKNVVLTMGEHQLKVKIRKEIGYKKSANRCCFVDPGVAVAQTAVYLHFITCFPAPEKLVF